MKKKMIDGLVSLFVFLATPQLSLAQGNIFSVSVAAPDTNVSVTNTTNRAALIDVGGTTLWAAASGGVVQKTYLYGTYGNVAVRCFICSSVQGGYVSNPLPAWAVVGKQNVVGSAAFPTNFNGSSISAVKPQVEKIKKALHDLAGGKEKEREISRWFKRFKKEGLGITAQCVDPKVIVQTVDVTANGYARAVALVLTSDRSGYALRVARGN